MEDKGKREKRLAAADRANKKQNRNDEGDRGGGGNVSPSSGKRGYSSGSGSDSENFGSNISRTIAKSRRGRSSSDTKNGLKRDSGSQTLQAQGRG